MAQRRKLRKRPPDPQRPQPIGPVNTTGLPSLATETLLEIVAHLKSVPVPCSATSVLGPEYFERLDAVRALSETCRRLRSVFHAQAWARLEVCANAKGHQEATRRSHRNVVASPRVARQLATELVRQAEVVTIRNPELAPLVKIASVALTEWSQITVHPEFVRCLTQLPNLETIQIITIPALERYRYNPPPVPFVQTLRTGQPVFPSVRTLVLHQDAIALLQCCPHVENLHINGRIPNHVTIQRIAYCAPNLHTFKCHDFWDAQLIELATHLPNLVEIPPLWRISANVEAALASMKSLCRITLVANANVALFDAAKRVLRRASPDGRGTGRFVMIETAQGVQRHHACELAPRSPMAT